MESPSSHRRQAVHHRWLPPTAGLVKTNYDGAMYGESDKARIGVVIRNCEGQVLAALSEQIVKPPTVEILELLAALASCHYYCRIGPCLVCLQRRF